MRTSLSFAALAFALLLTVERQAVAVPVESASDQPVPGVSRITRGPSFAPDDLITVTDGSLSRPRFDNSAGVFGFGGIQPASTGTGTLSGSYSRSPTAREFSASVMVSDAFATGDASSTADASNASDGATVISPGSTAAAAGGGDPGWGSGTGTLGADLAGAMESASLVRHAGSLNRSSVFVNGGSGTSGGPDARRFAGTAEAGLGTVQATSSLTAYQALTDASSDAAASNGTIEGYALAARSAAAGSTGATVQMPIRVSTISYGFLNSSLTVFSDESGAFVGVGQTFNGLTSLTIPEPASVGIMAAGLIGLAAARRRRARFARPDRASRPARGMAQQRRRPG
nr:PEP-CTERM sorting domain-containing protein [uncultured Rhodopila sp.]